MPSSEEIKRFLEVFDTLCQFEALSRKVRGYGAFSEDEIPSPEVIKVCNWLKELKDK
jgi:hypothetical protein